MQSKRCVVSVAFRTKYVEHSLNQERWIKENHPDLHCIFFRDTLPHKGGIYKENIVDRFQESLYGFKPHAIEYAINEGYREIIWFDPSVLPIDSLDVIFDALKEHPVIVRTGDQKLKGMVNQRALNWFGVKNIEDVNHVGGTIYAFNFNDAKAINIFYKWKEAEEAGMFGNQDDFMKGHWADEACMALSLHTYYHEQYFPAFKYLNQKEFT